MTVTTDICKAGPYEGDGVTAVFAVNFRFLDAAHLHVWYEQEQHKTVLVLGRDYTVAGVGQSEGQIHLSQPLAVGQALMIRREVPVTQLADYVQGDAFPAESHEMALDKLTMIAQQLKDGIDRAVKTADGEEQQPVELPALNDRKNKLLGFDGQGLPESVMIGSGLKLAEQMLMVKPGMGIVSNEAGVSVLIGDGLGMFDNAVVVKLGKGLEFDEQARAQVQEDLIKSVSSGSASIIELKGLIAHLTQRVEDLETGEGGEVAIYIGDGIRYDAQGRLTVKPGLGIQVDADGVSVILGEGLETGDQGQVQVSQALREGVSQLSGQMTQVTAGTTYPFNQDLCAEIGGYSKGAVLLGADGVTLWQSTVDANMTDPDSTNGNGWAALNAPKVAFCVTGGVAQTINYDTLTQVTGLTNINFNIGSSYSNGQFTAPVAGVYDFKSALYFLGISGTAIQAPFARIDLLKNGISMGSRYLFSAVRSDGYYTIAGEWSEQLDKGDVVTLHIFQSVLTAGVKLSASLSSFFSGRLVQLLF